MNPITLDGKKIYPSKIICIGRNYAAHIEELNNTPPDEPVIFLKPNSAISSELFAGTDEDIHYEGEISFVIAAGELGGVGFGLDLTKREIQSTLKAKGLPWERAKAFDGSAIFSEFVGFDGNIDDLRMELSINGRLVQQGGCELMLNKPRDLLVEAKGFLSLVDGDLFMTGTPKGVGPVRIGDQFNGRIFEKEKLLVQVNWLVR